MHHPKSKAKESSKRNLLFVTLLRQLLRETAESDGRHPVYSGLLPLLEGSAGNPTCIYWPHSEEQSFPTCWEGRLLLRTLLTALKYLRSHSPRRNEVQCVRALSARLLSYQRESVVPHLVCNPGQLPDEVEFLCYLHGRDSSKKKF